MATANVLSLPRAELRSLFLETLLFGVFVVLYLVSIWILVRKENDERRARLNRWMLATATMMFLLAIAHLSLDVQRAFQGFIVSGGVKGGTTSFYSRLNNPTHIAKTGIYVMQSIVGDSFMIYRLYVVWSRKLLILVPSTLLLIGTMIAGFGICGSLSQLHGDGVIFAKSLAPWITSYFTLSLSTNVLTTLLIVARIVWSQYTVRKQYTSSVFVLHWGVVETIVQSAALYSVALFSLLITYVVESNAQYICLDALSPLVGIVFTTIIIRVGLKDTTDGWSRAGHTISAELHANTSTSAPRSPYRQQYSLRPLAVNVSVTRTQDCSSLAGSTDLEDQKTSPDDVETGLERGAAVLP